MFFVFSILIIINYISNSSNYALKRINQGVDGNIKPYDYRVDKEDGHNNSWVFTTHKSLFEVIENSSPKPNLKANLFDKKLSDEMLSIKQNIFGRGTDYTFSKVKNTRTTVGPNFEVTQKWPDVFEGNRRKTDDYDLKQLFPKEQDNRSRNIEIPLKNKSFSNTENYYDHQLKNKVVDREAPPNNWNKQDTSKCTCCQNSRNPPDEFSVIPAVSTMPHKCNSCTRTTVLFSFMPVYVPYAPYVNYPPHAFKPTLKGSPQNDLYYDEKDGNVITNNNGNCDLKELIKKTNKNDAGNVNTKPNEHHILWDTAFLEARPNKLVKDLVNDLSISYPESVIRKCYCSSSSVSSVINLFCIALLSCILFVVIFNVLSMH